MDINDRILTVNEILEICEVNSFDIPEYEIRKIWDILDKWYKGLTATIKQECINPSGRKPKEIIQAFFSMASKCSNSYVDFACLDTANTLPPKGDAAYFSRYIGAKVLTKQFEEKIYDEYERMHIMLKAQLKDDEEKLFYARRKAMSIASTGNNYHDPYIHIGTPFDLFLVAVGDAIDEFTNSKKQQRDYNSMIGEIEKPLYSEIDVRYKQFVEGVFNPCMERVVTDFFQYAQVVLGFSLLMGNK